MEEELVNQSDSKRYYAFDAIPNVLVPGGSNIVIRTDGAHDSTKYEVHFLPTIQSIEDSSSPPPPLSQPQPLTIDEKQIIIKKKKRPAHMQPQQDTQRFPCPRCGRDYSQSKNMRRHYRLECQVEPRYACQLCQLRFKRNNQLKNHVMIKHCFSNAQNYNN